MNSKLKYTLILATIPFIATLWAVSARDLHIMLNSLFSILCMFGLLFFDKKIRIFSLRIYAIVLVFILLSIFAGRSLGFYYKIPYWDKFLHFMSGFIFVIIGKQIYKRLNGPETSLIIIKTYTFFFAVTGATFWEIYEFLSDKILGTTAQNNSLTDTMLDVILGAISAFIGSLI